MFTDDVSGSFLKVPKYVIDNMYLFSHAEFKLLLLIGYYDPTYRKYETLMRMTGIKNRNTFAKVVNSLETRGVLRVDRIKEPGNIQNTYSIRPLKDWRL